MIVPTDVPCPFELVYTYLARRLKHASSVNEPPHQMQQLREDPRWVTRELVNVSFEYAIPRSPEQLTKEIRPNLPWADEHFEERVSGIPHNPPPSHVHWPFAQEGNDGHLHDGKFSHTYPERMWTDSLAGIRFNYGDLGDLLALLADHPYTRQAYLPIWFPEDLTAANAGERVPCTLGYHFLMRDGKLNLTYFIRSCDLVRFFRDDIYMACRLVQWVLAHDIMKQHTAWDNVKPGKLCMHIVSLHCFEGDVPNLLTPRVKRATRQA